MLTFLLGLAKGQEDFRMADGLFRLPANGHTMMKMNCIGSRAIANVNVVYTIYIVLKNGLGIHSSHAQRSGS